MSDAAVKAVAGERWELDVLGVPFGGPHGGKDSTGEFFDERTNFHEHAIPLPPVVYYHGFTPDGRPAGAPEWIGKTVRRWVDAAGVWYRVVLDQASDYARRVWEAATGAPNTARASSGTMTHLRRVGPDGHIKHWVVSELSLFDTGPGRQPANTYAVALPAVKALYAEIGLELPSIGTRISDTVQVDLGPRERHGPVRTRSSAMEDKTEQLEEAIAEAFKAGVASASASNGSGALTNEQVKALVDRQVERLEAERREREDAERRRQQEIAEAVKAETARLREEYEEQLVAARRLPLGGGIETWNGQAPVAAKFAALRPYDGLDAADTAFLAGLLASAKLDGTSRRGVSEAALKALAVKLDEDRSAVGYVGQQAMKALGIKANEVMTSTMTGYGDEWVGQAYSTSLWEQIRLETFVVDLLRPVDIPEGAESVTLPTEGADPVFYAVGQATDTDASGWPAATVPASKSATGQRVLRPAKLGGRILWEGDLEEDAVLPFAAQLRRQMGTSSAETLEHVILDGDTVMTAATNINNGGVADAPYSSGLAKAPYTLFDGFRKLALVTNTANARDGATLEDTDFLETIKLMGPSGRNAVDKNKVLFVIDVATNWKAIQLASVKTRDLNSNATVESGNLAMIWGYKVKVSGQLARAGGGLTNASGKVDQVAPENNTKGQILAVRPDQWAFGRKRLLKLETTRIARADSYEIVGLMRVALINRDLESAALSYNLGV